MNSHSLARVRQLLARAEQQRVVRVDREATDDIGLSTTQRLARLIEDRLPECSAVIVGDYGKGVITQGLLDQLKSWCRARGLWLSLDPKPVHHLNLSGLSLITPNRKEAFELAGLQDGTRRQDPLQDETLMRVTEILL